MEIRGAKPGLTPFPGLPSEGAAAPAAPSEPSASAAELRDDIRLAELQRQDAFVRRYAESRALAAGSSATYRYVQGPDGKRYVESGSVSLNAYEIPGDPAATLREARNIRRIAEHGPSLSPADRSASVEARRIEWEARRDLLLADAARRGLYSPQGRRLETASPTGGFLLTA
ncbi:MAG TPA: putative metalloprotease CJM1_0395 family protein [Candidatus Ozemobacteraceae bacterium]|nr:putative metalloprotease CJM1_0395 family protein [Candidatus Ozemobacteraceae bacterium]